MIVAINLIYATKRLIHFGTILTFILSFAVEVSGQSQKQFQTSHSFEFFTSSTKKSSKQFAIRKIKILGSSVFSQQELYAVTKEFLNKEATIANSVKIREKIAQLYISNGYITSGAFLSPQQDVSDGIVEIQVVEGRLEELKIEGLVNLEESYVRSRLAIQTPLNINKLQESLQLLRNDPLVENISANLARGSSLGSSLLSVKVREVDPWSIGVNIDNARSPAIGSTQISTRFSNANVLGFGDRADFNYAHTKGSNLFNFSYQIPVNRKNGKVRAAYATSSNEVVEQPFNELDIQSESRVYELSYQQPVIITPTEELTLGITASRIESEFSLLGARFPLTLGADEQGRTRISALRFFQEYAIRGSKDVFTARSQISWGLGAFQALVGEEPDSQFLSWQLQTQYVRLLAPETPLILRGEFQLADQGLLADERFRLGGTGSVRGYRQDLLLGDNGLFASAEVRVPIVQIPEWETVLQVVPFFDVGKVWSSNGDNQDQNTLASMGLGLLLTGEDDLSAGFFWGIPLLQVDDQGNSFQEEGGSFFIRGQIRF
jgi:hemolysin activation/secretion protein